MGLSPVSPPTGPSARLVLTANGGVTKESLLTSRINELNSGTYRICMATKESLADSQTDFDALTSSFYLYDDDTHVELKAPYIVSLGQDIKVEWSLHGKEATGLDWIGLYRKDSCKQNDNSKDNNYPLQDDESPRHTQNTCYLAMEQLDKYHTSGVIRFSFDSFRNAGDYEVRFFMGDSRNGQGMVCRGLNGLVKGYESSPEFESCALEAQAVSNSIKVTAEKSRFGGLKSKNSGPHIPGLEHTRHATLGL